MSEYEPYPPCCPKCLRDLQTGLERVRGICSQCEAEREDARDADVERLRAWRLIFKALNHSGRKP